MVLALAKGLFYSSPTQRARIQQRLSVVPSEFVKKYPESNPKQFMIG